LGGGGWHEMSGENEQTRDRDMTLLVGIIENAIKIELRKEV
jgi:hypothetical protein